jgi:hypothetical protein
MVRQMRQAADSYNARVFPRKCSINPGEPDVCYAPDSRRGSGHRLTSHKGSGGVKTQKIEMR